eukprot:3038127-Alexandrium_andersonii.AAC.1
MPAAGSTPSAASAASFWSRSSFGREFSERSQTALPRSSSPPRAPVGAGPHGRAELQCHKG